MLEVAKHEKLYRALKNKLLQLNPGDKILSIRHIMQNYSVSKATVIRSVERLKAENLIRKNVGLGTFVTDEVLKYKENAKPIILIAIPRWNSTFYGNIEDQFELAQATSNSVVEFLRYDWKDEIPRMLPNKKIDGLIVIASSNITPEHIEYLDSYKRPYLFFDISAGNLPANSVTSNNYSIGSQAADHLIKLGHKKIALVISEPQILSINDIIDGFCQYSELQGANVEIIDCGVKKGDLGIEKVYRRFKERLKETCSFTGIFVTSSASALAIYKAAYENNMRIPEDLSLISAGYSPDCAYYYPALTNIDYDIPKMVSFAMDILISQINNKERKEFKLKKVKPKIMIRDSTISCNK